MYVVKDAQPSRRAIDRLDTPRRSSAAVFSQAPRGPHDRLDTPRRTQAVRAPFVLGDLPVIYAVATPVPETLWQRFCRMLFAPNAD